MVEAAINLHSFIVSPIPTQELKLPFIYCAGKLVELHDDNKISIINQEKTLWMRKNEHLSKFLDKNFTQIQKIEILKKVFHGLHTEERFHAIQYIGLLKEKKK